MNNNYKNIPLTRLYYYILLFFASTLLLNNVFFSGFNNNIKLSINKYSFSFINFFKQSVPNYYNIIGNNYTIISNLEKENTLLKGKLALASENIIKLNTKEKQLEDLNVILHTLNLNKIQKIITTSIVVNGLQYPNKTFVVNLGSNHQVTPNTLIVSSIGVIGYIKEVYNNYSLVISTVNPSFKISAKTSINNINLVISGNNSLTPDVTIYSSNQALVENDVVLTSGLEGFFPPNIPIGSLFKDKEGRWKINLLEKFDKLEYVHLVE